MTKTELLIEEYKEEMGIEGEVNGHDFEFWLMMREFDGIE